MELPKAKEILEDLLGESPQFPPDDRREAVQIGIEAIKRLQALRILHHPFVFNHLPYETSKDKPT